MRSVNYYNLIIATIPLLAGTFLLITGFLALANTDIKIRGLYEFGVFISSKLYGKEKIQIFEEEMKDRKTVVRYGLIWIFGGLASIIIGLFFLFVT